VFPVAVQRLTSLDLHILALYLSAPPGENVRDSNCGRE
jgi:hypothetical protein